MIGPSRFGPYELLDRVNRGGMAEVFRARDTRSGATVALKRILPEIAEDNTFIAMFEDEARIAARLEHPYIARVMDYGAVDDTYFIAFEYVAGKTLRSVYDRVRKGGHRIPIPVVMYVLTRITEGLSYAHARKMENGDPVSIVHRDVSPHNVMVSFDGDVKLIDFGIAKAAGRANRTVAGTLKGKFGYMAPEQARGAENIDQRVDVFALGICLWECLTMQRLFDAANEVLVLEQLRSAPIPAPSSLAEGVSPELDAIVRKALAKNVDDRYGSARELYRDLNSASQSLKAVATREQIAQYMAEVFPEEARPSAKNSGDNRENDPGKPAETPTNPDDETGANVQESDKTSQETKGSSLDVFEGLGKKSGARPGNLGGPIPPPPMPSQPPPLPTAPPTAPPTATSTANVAPPSLPTSPSAPAASRKPAAPPPPPSTAPSLASQTNFGPPTTPEIPVVKRTLVGMPLPSGLAAQASQAAQAAPAAMPLVNAPGYRSNVPPPPPPGRNQLPPVVAPPSKASGPVAPAQGSSTSAMGTPSQGEGASFDGDWDDDEATQIFDKGFDEGDKGQSLRARPAAGQPVALPPGMRPIPAMIATPESFPATVPEGTEAPRGSIPTLPGSPMDRLAGNASAQPPAYIPPPTAGALSGPRLETTAVIPPSSNRTAVFVGLGALGAAVVVFGLFMNMPRTGGIRIDAVDDKGAAVEHVEIFIDGRRQCDTTPCMVEQLPTGAHLVKVIANGYDSATPTQWVNVEAQKTQSLNVVLSQAAAKVATGLRVSSTQPGTRLTVDDRDVGALPTEVKELAPGAHRIRISGNERYESRESTIQLAKDQMLDVAAPVLRVIKGKATILSSTAGARVFLVNGEDRRELPTLPIQVDIDTAKSWTIEATKAGFEDFRQPITFADGQAEKSYDVVLTPKGTAAPAMTQVSTSAPSNPAPATKETTTKEATTPAKASRPSSKTEGAEGKNGAADTATGEGFLNINSRPPATVALDGKPMGSTPLLHVSVTPGTHTVLFVNSEEGLKKQITVTVGAGETKAATASLRD